MTTHIIRGALRTRRWRYAAGALAALVAVISCRDELTLPRSRPLAYPSGSSASRSTTNSPDLTTVTLGTLSAHDGHATASASVTFPYKTLVKISATGVITKVDDVPLYWWYHAHPSGSYDYTPNIDAALLTLYTGTGRNYRPSSYASGTATMYALLDATETITGAQRDVKPNEVAFAECNPTLTNCYVYCGGWYPPDCFHFQGDPGQFTIERQDVGISFSTDSTTVNTGSIVKFMVRSATDSIGGLKVPVMIDTAAWTPDADSLGGDYTDAATTGACTYSINPSVGDCWRRIVGSGTMRIVSHVNGKGFESLQHISVRDAHPILSASPDSTYKYSQPSDSIPFTVTMSDASTPAVNGWSWAPDSGTAATSGSCFSSHNPCKEAVREGGTLTATVTYGGVSKHARKHIKIKHRFTLDVDPGTVAPELVVAFTPYTDSVASGAARWRWVPDDAAAWDSVAGCSGSGKCFRMMFTSGTMWAYRTADPITDSAAAYVLVTTDCGSSAATRQVSTARTRTSARKADADVIPGTPPGCSGESLTGSSEAAARSQDTLFIKATAGVTGYPLSTFRVPDGAVVPYYFHAPAPYADTLAVTLDGAPTSRSGTVQMSGTRHLSAYLPAMCGLLNPDKRDSLRFEYLDDTLFNGSWMPVCADFDTTASTTNFSKAVLYDQVTAVFNGSKVGIFASGLFNQSTGWLETKIYTQWQTDSALLVQWAKPKLNSTYRSPARQSALYQEHGVALANRKLGGRHMFGDAVDIGTDSTWATWHRIFNLLFDSTGTGLTVLDTSLDRSCALHCVHVDARTRTTHH